MIHVSTPFMLGIWQSTLRDALHMVNEHDLGDNVVQFSPDLDMRGSVWVILRVTGDQRNDLLEKGKRSTPKWSFL